MEDPNGPVPNGPAPNGSEAEDNPSRAVLDLNAYYMMRGSDLGIFKLTDFCPYGDIVEGELVRHTDYHAAVPLLSQARRDIVMQRMGGGGNGVWTGTVFTPPGDATRPDEVFDQRRINSRREQIYRRFCIRHRHEESDPSLKTVAIFTYGTTRRQFPSRLAYRGGLAYVFNRFDHHGMVTGLLEDRGLDGQIHPQTNPRAELCAVTTALASREWQGEGWERIVIITHSHYVTDHTTGPVREWAAQNWVHDDGEPVANRDLWEELSRQMGKYAESGCEISFWLVPKLQNLKAERAASYAALTGKLHEKAKPWWCKCTIL